MLLLVSIIIFIVIVTVFSLLFLLWTSPSPVIWSFTESGSVSGEPIFVIFNPFREKESEAEAERFLNLLKEGKCKEAILNLDYWEEYEDMCERESRYELEDWRLSNREDSEQFVRLYYRLKRKNYFAGYSGEMWIEVEKTANGWRVRGVEAIY